MTNAGAKGRLRPVTVIAAGLAILLGALAVWPQGHPPDRAAGKMTTPDGFRVELVAAEPTVRQPVAIDFDERGRLWVMQYLQYPNPAGLKRVQVDRYSRTKYDRVPEPPPRGPRGADRLTVLALSPERPGRPAPKDFIQGLNLASGFAFGHGGVYVLQVPYLLFYPDRDRDDVPDEGPDVLLTGFGMEDAHSVANSLTWGPDGWLYGCQGSTVTANVRGIEFQQGVWRFHPITRRFELFCEGGGNSWGLDFDDRGELIYSTNHGGYVALHGVQGGYYWKSFGKHGALHNPFAYGYFDHIPHDRFTGGHVTVGGLVYRGGAYPAKYAGKYIGADLLGHAVHWHDLAAAGSSFRTRHGGSLVTANDTWFAPSDLCLGPDGCVYVADWHDARTAHPDPDAEWDRSNGRVFRISHRDVRAPAPFDLGSLPSAKLVALLSHPNEWYSRTARRLLADRRDPEVILPLRTLVMEAKSPPLALQALWALYVSGGFTEAFAERALSHPSADVRRWAVRLLGDEDRISPRAAGWLRAVAEKDDSVVVRSQLACTARRLPAEQGLPVLGELLRRDLDLADPHVPLLLWWGVERHAVAAQEAVVKLVLSSEVRDSSLARRVVLPRLVRRYVAEGRTACDEAVRRLLAACTKSHTALIESVDQGMMERPAGQARLSAPLLRALKELVRSMPDNTELLKILIRSGDTAAHRRALVTVFDPQAGDARRLALLPVVADSGCEELAPRWLGLIGGQESHAVQRAALLALHRIGGDGADRLLELYPRLAAPVRPAVRSALLGRREWARRLLAAVDAGKFSAREVAVEEVQVVAAHGDEGLNRLVRKHWGNVQGATPEEKLAEVRRLNNDLRAGAGDPARGKALFAKHCGTCHQLFGEGTALGPDLTHANRGDRQALLVHIVDPSRVIRREHLSYTATTKDGRVVSGLLVEQSPTRVVLASAKNERTALARGQVESLQESPVSLMPEGLLRGLKPQEVRDLFSHLQRPKAK